MARPIIRPALYRGRPPERARGREDDSGKDGNSHQGRESPMQRHCIHLIEVKHDAGDSQSSNPKVIK